MYNTKIFTIFVVDDKGKSSYTPLSRGGWGCVNVEPGKTLADKTIYMKALFIVSVDAFHSGADNLCINRQKADKTKDYFLQNLKNFKVNGVVTVSSVEVEDENYNYFIDNPDVFFNKRRMNDTYNQKVVEIVNGWFGRTKSKEDLERQMDRINTTFSGHRLFSKAQGLALLFNHNMSMTEWNCQMHDRYMALANKGNDEERLNILEQMLKHKYPIEVYAQNSESKGSYTRTYVGVEDGDWVRCTFCGQVMLLPHGAEKCPECGEEGHLQWMDEEMPERKKSELKLIYPVNRKLTLQSVFQTKTIQHDFPEAWTRIQQGKTVCFQ